MHHWAPTHHIPEAAEPGCSLGAGGAALTRPSVRLILLNRFTKVLDRSASPLVHLTGLLVLLKYEQTSQMDERQGTAVKNLRDLSSSIRQAEGRVSAAAGKVGLGGWTPADVFPPLGRWRDSRSCKRYFTE